ncbi:MAG: class I SAM-dependent methyltransferase [Oscillospiraceae bacterium]|nr:class I SAM-dependent methyltransferase [Candidatus Equicaccousia limihippi]
MRFTEDFVDYELIDAACGQKLERWGNIYLIRPEPQAFWEEKSKNTLWDNAHAIYHRSNSGGGYWEQLKKVPDVWQISYNELKFNLKPMGFKHTGLFPEQAVNWQLIMNTLKPTDKVLNLFAYTGAATLAALKTGASVTHVDASKGMTLWAKENARSSGLIDASVRWLVDDCVKFVSREIRRGNKYDAIIMDPPSYGRGPSGEIWKLEEKLPQLLKMCSEILSDNPSLFILNTYTAGISSTILNYLVKTLVFNNKPNGKIFTEEIGVKITDKPICMPCGNSTVWISEKIG